MKVKIINDEQQEFNGVIYTKNKEGYYFHNQQRLHRAVWQFHNGAIPKGCIVHHIDENKDNNQLSNLQCLTKAEHGKVHADRKGTVPPPHKEITHTCDYCGKVFTVQQKRAKYHFCSEACRSAYQYRCNENKETRVCACCGKEFLANKYSRTKCCSKVCGQALRFKGRSFKKICPVCEAEFETIASKDNQCCSHKCASILLWQTKRVKDRKEVRQCAFCGKDFPVDKPTQRFCSKSCATKFRYKKN